MHIQGWLWAVTFILSIPIAAARPLKLPVKDFGNSKDHPLISRFAGAVVLGVPGQEL